MATVWRILSPGVPTLTFGEAAPVDGAALNFINQGIDSMRFTHLGALVDSAFLYNYDARVVLTQEVDNGGQVPVFVGNVGPRPCHLQGGDIESISYLVTGPWRWLERKTYAQPFIVRTAIIPVPVPPAEPFTYTQRFIEQLYLGTKIVVTPPILAPLNQTRISVGDQIKDVLDYVLSEFTLEYPSTPAPFQYLPADLAALSFLGFVTQVANITCAEAVIAQLRMIEDAVVWFDYSTLVGADAVPTLRIQRRADCTAYTATIAAYAVGGRVTELELTPRDDLLVPCVAITYMVNQPTGIVDPQQDIWPTSATGREFDALKTTVELNAASSSSETVRVSTELIEVNDSAWFASHFPQYYQQAPSGDDFIQNLDWLHTSGALPYDYELLPPGLPGWVNVNAVEHTLEFLVSYEEYGWDATTAALTDDPIKVVEFEKLSLKIWCVPIRSRTFTHVTSTDTGDVFPATGAGGLANQMYDALSFLHWEGPVTERDAEISAIRMGNVLNIAGGRAEWTAMRAPVQQLSMAIAGGRVSTTGIQIGPPRHLGANDLVDRMKLQRPRMLWSAPSGMGNGGVPVNDTDWRSPRGGTGTGLGGRTDYQRYGANSVEIDGRPATGVDAADAATIQIFVKDLPIGAVAKFRPTIVCDETGAQFDTEVMMTEPRPRI